MDSNVHAVLFPNLTTQGRRRWASKIDGLCNGRRRSDKMPSSDSRTTIDLSAGNVTGLRARWLGRRRAWDFNPIMLDFPGLAELQSILRDRSIAARVDKNFRRGWGPAVGFLDAGPGAGRGTFVLAQLIVGLPGIDLQDALVGPQQLFGPHLSAARQVGVKRQPRIGTTKGPVVADDDPHVARFGLGGSRRRHLDRGFVDEQP